MSRGSARWARVALVVLALIMVAGLLVHPTGGARAWAAAAETTSRGSHLQLTSMRDASAMEAMAPHVPVTWQVGLRTTTSERGPVRVSLHSAAPARQLFEGSISACQVRWNGGECPTGERLILAPASLNDRATLVMDEPSAPIEQWYLVRVWFDEMPTSVGTAMSLTVVAEGFGETVSTGEARAVPASNAGTLVALGAVGAAVLAAMILVFLLAVLTRRRRRA